MSATTNITLRLPTELVERIDHAAGQRAQNRTEYIVSWLPVKYDRTAPTGQHKAEQRQRASRAAGESSPAHT